VTSGARRTGRTVALAVSTILAAAFLLFLRSPATTGAAPADHCTGPTSVPCTPETTLPSTTTTIAETTSTTEASTTTTEAPTSTTRRATSTTQERATTTTLSPSTSVDVLVPGDGTAGADQTTTTQVTATRISSGGPSDGTLISLVIVGLLLIAGVVSVLTWRYWVATRPPLLDADPRSVRPG